MKKLMLAIVLMSAFATTIPAAADRTAIPIPEEDNTLPPPDTTPEVPSCWPVCN